MTTAGPESTGPASPIPTMVPLGATSGTPKGRGPRSAFFRAQRSRANGHILSSVVPEETAAVESEPETSLVVPIAAMGGCLLLATTLFGWLG